MFVGDRLRAIREERRLFQGDIEKRTGLLQCYISRVEHGHTVPSLETLEKFARALKVPLYWLFYEGEKDPKPGNLDVGKTANVRAWGSAGKDARTLSRLRSLLRQMKENDRRLLLHLARKMGARRVAAKKSSKD